MKTTTAPLTRERIIMAAVEIADDDGLDAVSLRGVAAKLDVTPMALYRHLSAKDELAELVVGRLLERQTANRRWPTAWDAVLRLAATQTYDVLVEHPIVLEALQRRAITSPVAVAGLERTLATLTAAGLTTERAVDTYADLITHTFGHAALRVRRAQTRSREGRTEAEERADVARSLASLPADEYPHLVAASAAVAGILDKRHFRDGVERIIASVRLELETTARAMVEP